MHFKPSGDPGEVDETLDMAGSAGLDASPSAFDFWVPGGDGLGGNNGVLSLYERPGGAMLDGVLYSNRTSESDELYGGFGTADTLFRARELVSDGGWKIAGEQRRPRGRCQSRGEHGHPLDLQVIGQRGHGQRRRLAHRAHARIDVRDRQLG